MLQVLLEQLGSCLEGRFRNLFVVVVSLARLSAASGETLATSRGGQALCCATFDGIRVPKQSQTRTRLLLNAPSSRSHPRSC